MRTFIGVDFSRETKDGLAKLQAIVRENSEKGRFKYIGNFHLTLKFLGEIEREKAGEIGRMLQEAADISEGFNLNINKTGYFGSRDGIRTLWLGLGGEVEKLQSLYRNIENSMNKIGLKRDPKDYIPHITIAQDLKLRISVEELEQKLDPGSISPIAVREVSFIKSEEIERKRIYTPISTFRLK